MDRSQASRRSRSASPQREDRHPDRRRNDDHSSRPIRRDRYDDERGYDRDTGRDDFREIGRRREDDRSAHYRSQDRPRNDKVTGGLRFKGDSKPGDKRERKADDSRREERSRPLETEVEAGENGIEEGRKERKEKKEKKRKVELPAELMIKVTVNDRLGTKAQIPCYGSDNIGKKPSPHLDRIYHANRLSSVHFYRVVQEASCCAHRSTV